MEPNSTKPWVALVVDDDESVHEITKLALRRARFFGLPVELKAARSKAEALAMLGQLDSNRLAVALVDVVMEQETSGLELVEILREKFGTPLQIVMRTGQPGVMAPEDVTSRFDISNYIAKVEATPERLRTAVGLGIRNFRTHAAIRVLCESLATFTSLFETATTEIALDQILVKALAQYSAVWQFEYLFRPDTQVASPPSATWQEQALRQLQSLELSSYRSVSFRQLTSPDNTHLWGCSVRPLGGRFSAAFALRQQEKPSDLLLRELHTLLRTWALTRESVLLKQIAVQDQNVRAEMHRERSQAIAQMVAGVAHEVNTPLGVANAAAAMLRDVLNRPHFKALAASDDEELAEDLDDVLTSANLIQRNIARADELIRSFRQLSVRQLVDVREEVDFLACVNDAITLYAPKAKRSGLQVNLRSELLENPPTWLGYPGHLSQVILNLVANAERYAYDGQAGVVDIVVSCSQSHELPEFRIVVRDYGSGIPRENLALIFEAFFTTGRSKGGTGLGLSIVRNIVSSVFGGTVSCESTIGEGTAFKIAFSHCKKQESSNANEDRSGDRAEIFEQFVSLQERLVAGERLTSEEQIQIAELRTRVESFLNVQFHTEKRQHPRIPCKCNVVFSDPDLDPAASMLDLGEGGALISLSRPVTVGQRMTIAKIDQTAIELRLEVLSVTELDNSENEALQWKCGVKFLDLSGAQSRTIKLLLAQLMLQYWRWR